MPLDDTIRTRPPESAATEPARVPAGKVHYNADLERFYLNGNHVTIEMNAHEIRVGCHEVTIEAARKLLELHEMRFGRDLCFWRVQ